MSDLSGKKANFVSRTVDGVTRLLDAIGDLSALRVEYDSLGLSPGSSTPWEIKEDDLIGANAHLSPQNIGDAFASMDTLNKALLIGHITNLQALRR